MGWGSEVKGLRRGLEGEGLRWGSQIMDLRRRSIEVSFLGVYEKCDKKKVDIT